MCRATIFHTSLLILSTLLLHPALALAQDDIPPLPTATSEEADIPPLPTKKEADETHQQDAQRETDSSQAQVASRQEPTGEDDYSLGTRLVGRLKHSFRAAAWLQTTGYTVGTTMQRGQGQFSSRQADLGGPSTMGYTLQERNGVVSGLVLAALAQGGLLLCAGATAASAYSYVGSETSYDYRTDGSVWVSQTDYYQATADADDKFASSQEMINVANSGSAMGAMAGYGGGQNFEFTYFTDDWLGRGTGQTQGVRANFLLGFPANDHLIFEAGYGWGRTTSSFEGQVVESRFNGIPLRLLAPFGPFMAQAGLDMNASRLFTILDDAPTDRELNAPWPISLSMHAFLWRLHASAGIEIARIIKRDVGYNLNIGMRF